MSRPRPGPRRGPVPLAASIERLRRDLGVPPPDVTATVGRVLREVLGPLADRLHDARLRGTVLVLVASDPTSAEAVQLRVGRLVEALAAAEPPVAATRVDVRVDRRPGGRM